MDEPKRQQTLPSRENTFSNVQPTRSHTDPTATEPKQERERSHLSKRLHASSLRSKALPGSAQHRHHHSVRHAARNTVQSAIDLKPPTSFDALLGRRQKSPEGSRRGSTNPQAQAQQEWDFAQQQAEAERRRVKPEDVQKIREENEQREVELRGALKKVEELGMQSTRQLDNTYYSILEKAETLRNTVQEMQRLANDTRATRENFESSARELEQDVTSTLDGFGEFKQQEETVDALVERLAESKRQTDTLNGRLEDARKRVEAYHRAYREQQAKRRKQIHITWSSLLAAAVVIVAILITKNRQHLDLPRWSDGIGDTLMKVGGVLNEAASPVTTKLKSSHTQDPVLESIFEGVT